MRPTQVQLRVKVAEVKRDALKRVGINWQNINNIALFGTGNFLAGFAVRTTSQIGGAVSTGALQFATRDGSLNTLVDFLATQNQATILAEPNLIAMSGETASFLAGGEVPLLMPAERRRRRHGHHPVQAGRRQPRLHADHHRRPHQSQRRARGQRALRRRLDQRAARHRRRSRSRASAPARRRRPSSSAAGRASPSPACCSRTRSQDINKFPWLGDVPVLGTLFKSDAYRREETELVIIITPYFVEPTSNKLQTPLTGRVPPTDVDRLVMQRFNHPTPPRRLAVGRETTAVGPTAGFKLD